MIKLLKKLPMGISVPIFYTFITLVMLYRFLFSSVYGALILALGLYFYTKHFTSIEPFTAQELLTWSVSISSEYKTALLSSFVTIIGFIIAFHTATLNWKQQMQAQLKSKASDDIDNFFHVVQNNIRTVQLYIESLIRIINDIQNSDSTKEEISSRIEYQQNKAHDFFAARDVLAEASIEVHRLINSKHNILTSDFGQTENMNTAAQSLHTISNKIWLHIPIIKIEDENHIQSFFNQVNVTQYNELIDICEVNSGKIAGLSGAVRGTLDYSVWGFSFTQFANLMSIRKDFKKIMQQFRDDLNK